VKLTSNRYYLDFNATSPFAPAVTSWLAKGDFAFGNPSSVHRTGKVARRLMLEASEALFELFQLPEHQFDLFFHSGASEGINTCLKGFACDAFKQDKRVSIAVVGSDHSSARQVREDLIFHGHEWIVLEVNREGELEVDKAIEKIKAAKYPVLLNFTWVNNETGVVFPLEWAKRIKEQTGCRVHVDAVQAVGKIPNWCQLLPELDAYTFSAHKFGALKGCGFTFIKPDLPFHPLIRGGGQQKAYRSGTENTLGIQSIPIALKELKTKYNFEEQNQATRWLENKMLELIGERGEVLGQKAQSRNGNTIDFRLDQTPAQTLAMALDMAGVDVSNGSACSSGAVIASPVLLAMGRNEEEAKSAIRLSFSAYLKLDEVREFYPIIESILKRYIP
jgi:cysteine desulfurase